MLVIIRDLDIEDKFDEKIFFEKYEIKTFNNIAKTSNILEFVEKNKRF